MYCPFTLVDCLERLAYCHWFQLGCMFFSVQIVHVHLHLVVNFRYSFTVKMKLRFIAVASATACLSRSMVFPVARHFRRILVVHFNKYGTASINFHSGRTLIIALPFRILHRMCIEIHGLHQCTSLRNASGSSFRSLKTTRSIDNPSH